MVERGGLGRMREDVPLPRSRRGTACRSHGRRTPDAIECIDTVPRVRHTARHIAHCQAQAFSALSRCICVVSGLLSVVSFVRVVFQVCCLCYLFSVLVAVLRRATSSVRVCRGTERSQISGALGEIGCGPLGALGGIRTSGYRQTPCLLAVEFGMRTNGRIRGRRVR